MVEGKSGSSATFATSVSIVVSKNNFLNKSTSTQQPFRNTEVPVAGADAL